MSCLSAVLLAFTVSAADTAHPLAGKWKLTLLASGQQTAAWLIELRHEDNAWNGKVLAAVELLREGAALDDVRVDGDRIRFTVRFQNIKGAFDGQRPRDSKAYLGALELGGDRVLPARLEPTKLTTLDRFELAKEMLAGTPTDAELFDATLTILRQAGAKKAKPDEAKAWADRALRTATAYGPRWQRTLALLMAEALVGQPGMAPLAVEYVRQAEKLTPAEADDPARIRMLSLLANALTRAGQPKEAREVRDRIDRVERHAFEMDAVMNRPFTPDKYAGRTAKSDRAVLVELFTGAQAPSAAAADLAFAALAQTYKPNEVVLLAYHLNQPSSDPLTNADAEARGRFYAGALQGVPTVFFNGKPEAGGGGTRDEAQDKYKDYREAIDPYLDTTAKAKLNIRVERKGDALDISAEAADVQTPGERTRLRLAVIEEWVPYVGASGVRFHHFVVRAMPGGVSGLPLKTKSGKQTARVNLAELRQEQGRYLDSREYTGDRPEVSLRRLRVVAFVQNDQTREILQAAQAAVPANEVPAK